MNPGNDGALHSMLSDYAEYDEFPLTLGGEEVTVYHAQYAKYPVERAARVLFEELSLTPAEYDDYAEFRTALLDDTADEVEAAIEGTSGLHVEISDEGLFDDGEYLYPTDLQHEVTRLVELYDGFDEDTEFGHGGERYGEGRRVPETGAEFVADLLTLYNVHLAELHVDGLRFHTLGDDWSEDEAQAALYGMRDAVEREHGWSVFDAPSPSFDEAEALWQMATEVGFPRDGMVEWAYALYVVPHGAGRYEVRDSLDRVMRHITGETMSLTMRSELGGSPAPRGMKWTAEETAEEDLEAHREQMRENRE